MQRFDVVVYGGTAGGVMAAVAAARHGCRVMLVEPGRHVGGMVSGGLSHTDYGIPEVIGGLARDFYTAVARHYDEPLWATRGPEPHVAEAILRGLLAEAGVQLVFDAPLAEVEHADGRITSIAAGAAMVFDAPVFVDASYEGDLLARAGVRYSVGRESVETYGETWAGRQPNRPDKHNFAFPVSPFVNGESGPLLPLVHGRPLVREGAGDGGVQAYCFRLCLTDNPANRLPFPRPPGYDPAEFELLRRLLEVAGERIGAGTLMSLSGRLPNDKIDVNSIGPLSTNLLDGSSWEYPEADAARRSEIWQRHLSYTQGLLYFLANEPVVPAHIRDEMGRWGLCRDEFTDTAHWPHQLYVRDARRMHGEYLMTEADLVGRRRKYDAIGVGSYNIDIREVQRSWQLVPHYPRMVAQVVNEGYLSVPVEPYAIPYRALVPTYGECANLLVPVCVSASHVAFASLRMEPQYMIMGHAAGVAAALAVRDGIAVQQVGIVELQRVLRAEGQILDAP